MNYFHDFVDDYLLGVQKVSWPFIQNRFRSQSSQRFRREFVSFFGPLETRIMWP